MDRRDATRRGFGGGNTRRASCYFVAALLVAMVVRAQENATEKEALGPEVPLSKGVVNEDWVLTAVDVDVSLRYWPVIAPEYETGPADERSYVLQVMAQRFGHLRFTSNQPVSEYSHICFDILTDSVQIILTMSGYHLAKGHAEKVLAHTIIENNVDFGLDVWNTLSIPLPDPVADISWYQVGFEEKSVQETTSYIQNLAFCNANTSSASSRYYQSLWTDDGSLVIDPNSNMREIEPVYLSGFGLSPRWEDRSYTGFFDFSYVLPSGDIAAKALVGPSGALSLSTKESFASWKVLHFEILSSSNDVSLCLEVQDGGGDREKSRQCVYSLWNQTSLSGSWVDVAVPLLDFQPWYPWNSLSLVDDSEEGVFFIVTNILFNMDDEVSPSTQEIWVLEISDSPTDLSDILFNLPFETSSSGMPGWSIGIVIGVIAALILIPILICIVFPSQPGRRMTAIPLCCVAARETLNDVIEDITFSPRFSVFQIPRTVKMKAADKVGWVENAPTLLTDGTTGRDSCSYSTMEGGFQVYTSMSSERASIAKSETYSMESLPSPWKAMFGASACVSPMEIALSKYHTHHAGSKSDTTEMIDSSKSSTGGHSCADFGSEGLKNSNTSLTSRQSPGNLKPCEELTDESPSHSGRSEDQSQFPKILDVEKAIRESCTTLMEVSDDLSRLQKSTASQRGSRSVRRVVSEKIVASIPFDYYDLLDKHIKTLQNAQHVVKGEVDRIKAAGAAHTSRSKITLEKVPSRTDVESMNVDFVKHVRINGLIGSGGSGCVYHGFYKGHRVAIKMLHSSDAFTEDQINSLKAEVTLLQNLRHRNIVNFLGSCLEPPNICVLLEYAEGGSLHNMLHNNQKQPEYGTLLQLAEDVASAMDYCHSLDPPVIHRDLKPQNILLRRDGRAQVADFGIARLRQQTFVETTHLNAGTVAYMSPEIMQGDKVDEKCDVYSFGVIMWECLTGHRPWSEKMLPMQVVMAVGVEGNRLPVPLDCPISLRKLIKDCWRHDPRLRPTFREIKLRLAYIRNKHAMK